MNQQPNLVNVDFTEVVQALAPEGTETVTMQIVTDPTEIAAIFQGKP